MEGPDAGYPPRGIKSCREGVGGMSLEKELKSGNFSDTICDILLACAVIESRDSRHQHTQYVADMSRRELATVVKSLRSNRCLTQE